MSRCLVTGAAGFIGSHLSEALLAMGHDVVGVDAFIPYYPRPLKETNLKPLIDHPRFVFHELDLRTAELAPAVDGCDVIFNEAAMAGLMKSWSEFELYVSCNIIATKRLLEAARDARTAQFIHISTSSVYGKDAVGAPEDKPLTPFSPYGVTKVGAENLCRAFEANFGVPVTILRYFSVYGPRQRPDMAYNILIRAFLDGRSFTMYGDGEQSRSNTYVADCVNATLLAFEKRDAALGEVFNVGGGEVVTLNNVIRMLEELTGKKAVIERKPPRPGDQKHTAANIAKAQRILGYKPATPVLDGLRAQVEWQRKSA
ncbi:MAG: dTDP-glucose 4,6-dehydratase [Verrucomicrobia bacterium ADurb.Bin345]|nr:MAG: dTDP-glucose 4,6-dehydratase [Verrucomicrobia bacterium ADurb.Bin345]